MNNLDVPILTYRYMYILTMTYFYNNFYHTWLFIGFFGGLGLTLRLEKEKMNRGMERSNWESRKIIIKSYIRNSWENKRKRFQTLEPLFLD